LTACRPCMRARLSAHRVDGGVDWPRALGVVLSESFNDWTEPARVSEPGGVLFAAARWGGLHCSWSAPSGGGGWPGGCWLPRRSFWPAGGSSIRISYFRSFHLLSSRRRRSVDRGAVQVSQHGEYAPVVIRGRRQVKAAGST
jgi:hypothetical protein